MFLMTTSDSQNRGCFALILDFLGIKPETSPLEEVPYRLRDDFLSPAEISFYHVLRSVVKNRLTIAMKVRLADIFFVAQPNKNLAHYNRITRRHVDFLLCEPATMRPLVGIELDDSTHQRKDRRERDEFVNRVFKTAKLPLLRVPVKSAYSTREIAELLQGVLPSEGREKQPSSPLADQQTILQNQGKANVPSCPKCGSPMVIRTVKKGQHQGKQFYGCSNFPKCRGVLPLPASSSHQS
ncbi:MAG: DUF2726 domain-containing protein [Caldilineae bacterium]|nr:MAG: DUF2726 domain-containing protein [Caldilineae bacterium]